MGSIELLAREDEFKRLNKQLEKKTESLMKEIEQSMQKQDIFTEFSPSLLLNNNNTKKHCCTTSPKEETVTPNKIKNKNNVSSNSPIFYSDEKVKCVCCTPKNNEENIEFLYAFISINIKNNVLPASFGKDKVSIESVCKFLSSKIKLMEEQINKLQNIIDKKTSQCESHMTQLAELEAERMTLLNRSNNMKSSTADIRAKYMVLQRKYEEKEKQYKEQRSETDRLNVELKRTLSKTVNLEARCASQEQTIEALKQQIEISRKSEKEFHESTRILATKHENTISRLEHRIKAMTSKMAKQNDLIVNLRKQNLLLATDGAVKCLEKQYCDFLNQDF